MQLRRATQQDRDYLYSVLQKYLYELSVYYRDSLDERGDIAYPWFDSYFSDPNREAYLFSEGADTVGFAMLNKHSDLGEEIEAAIAEFTIFPPYRHKGKGKQALDLLFQGRTGVWELTYHNQNEGAVAFWDRSLKLYKPEYTQINGAETVLLFKVF